jgi:hypothetical protein
MIQSAGYIWQSLEDRRMIQSEGYRWYMLEDTVLDAFQLIFQTWTKHVCTSLRCLVIYFSKRMQHFSLGAQVHLLLCQQLDPAEALPESAGASPLIGCRLPTVSLLSWRLGQRTRIPRVGHPCACAWSADYCSEQSPDNKATLSRTDKDGAPSTGYRWWSLEDTDDLDDIQLKM